MVNRLISNGNEKFAEKNGILHKFAAYKSNVKKSLVSDMHFQSVDSYAKFENNRLSRAS